MTPNEERRAEAYEFAMSYGPYSNSWIARMMSQNNFTEKEIKQALDDLDHVFVKNEWTKDGKDIRELSVKYRLKKAGFGSYRF